MANVIRRNWSFIHREDGPTQSKRSPKGRSRHQDEFHHVLKSTLLTKPEILKTAISEDVSGAARPASKRSSRGDLKRDRLPDQLADNPKRSTSASMSMTLENAAPVGSSMQSNNCISRKAVADDCCSSKKSRDLPSTDGAFGDTVVAHTLIPGSSSIAIVDPYVGRTHAPRTSSDGGTEYQVDVTDSGSAPTLILELSNHTSDDLLDEPGPSFGSTITETFSQVLVSLRGIYGPSYQRADDIAGICSPQCTERIMDYPSPRDMSTQLDSMASQIIDKAGRALRGSITPWLSAPLLYSQAMQKADSTTDQQTSHTRSYVSSWIFISLAASRIDGLRFVFTVYLSFRIYGSGVVPDLFARVAADAEREWLKDVSNISPEEGRSKESVERHGFRTRSPKAPKSVKSSKAAAPAGGLDRNDKQDLISNSRYTPGFSTKPVAQQQLNEPVPEDESIESSNKDDETAHPGSQAHLQPDPQQYGSSNLQKEKSSEAIDADLEGLESDDVQAHNTAHVTQNSLPKSQQSNASEDYEPSHSSSRNKTLESGKGRQAEQHVESLPCDDLSCERTFVNESELRIHMDLRHEWVYLGPSDSVEDHSRSNGQRGK